MKKVFSPSKRLGGRYRDTIAIDTETDGAGGNFVLAAAYGTRRDHHGKTREISEVFHSEKDLQDFVLRLKESAGKKNTVSFVFHNAGFDLKYLSPVIEWGSAIFSGTQIIAVKTINGSEVFDTFNFLKDSLENLIKSFQLEKYGIKKLSLDNLEERCIMDAKATWYLFDYLQRFFIDNYNVGIRKTLPACALSVFNKHYFHDFWERDDEETDTFEREAYYGGRVEVFQRGERDYDSYDVNSMYPAVMSSELLPKPDSAYWVYQPSAEKLLRLIAHGTQFVADMTVYVPDTHIPPLPYRDGKLVFPVGTFSGVWCSPEIAEAISSGAEIVNVRRILAYRKSFKYLSEYADDIYQRRLAAKAGGNDPLSHMYKLMLNSLYGKFGERVGAAQNYIPMPEEYKIKEGDTPFLAADGNWYLLAPKEEKSDTQHTFCCIAAFITSFARVRLYRGLTAFAPEEVIYCDTDSVKVKAGSKHDLEVDDSKLGAWKYEGRNAAIFYRPKLYADRMKGVPKRHTVISRDMDRILVAFERVIKRKESIRYGKSWNAFVPAEKEIDLTDDKREWVGEYSRPLSLTIEEETASNTVSSRGFYGSKEVNHDGRSSHSNERGRAHRNLHL